MKPIRNVIFDLGGVLLDWNPGRILESVYADGPTRERMRAELFIHNDWRGFDRGDLTEDELLARIQRRTGRNLAELAGILDTVRHSLAQKPETVALLESLSTRGVPLYCLSNMPVSVFTHIRQRHGFWGHFRGIVISGEVRLAKPEPAVFEHILSRYGLAPDETAFVDDHPPNIESASALGLHAILFRDAEQCRRDLDACLQLGAG